MPTYVPILDAEVAAEQPVTVSLMTRLRDNALAYLGAPAGTSSLFQQTAAPLGWTKGTAHNDKTFRVVSGAVSSGGSLAFSTVFGKTATDGHILTQSELPSYNLNLGGLSWSGSVTINANATGISANVPSNAGPVNSAAGVVTGSNQAAGGNIAVNVSDPQHTHSGSVSGSVGGTLSSGGSGGSHTHPIDIRVQYVDVIIATKD